METPSTDDEDVAGAPAPELRASGDQQTPRPRRTRPRQELTTANVATPVTTETGRERPPTRAPTAEGGEGGQGCSNEKPSGTDQGEGQEDDVPRHVGHEDMPEDQVAEGVDQAGDQRHADRRGSRAVPTGPVGKDRAAIFSDVSADVTTVPLVSRAGRCSCCLRSPEARKTQSTDYCCTVANVNWVVPPGSARGDVADRGGSAGRRPPADEVYSATPPVNRTASSDSPSRPGVRRSANVIPLALAPRRPRRRAGTARPSATPAARWASR